MNPSGTPATATSAQGYPADVQSTRDMIGQTIAAFWQKREEAAKVRAAKKQARDKGRKRSGLPFYRNVAHTLQVPTHVAKAAVRAFHKTREEYAESYGGHPSFAIREGLEAAEKILNTEGNFRSYGVEGIIGQTLNAGGTDYRNPPRDDEGFIEYLNTGDTYRVTLAYDCQTERLTLTSWGDYVEKLDKKLGRIAEE